MEICESFWESYVSIAWLIKTVASPAVVFQIMAKYVWCLHTRLATWRWAGVNCYCTPNLLLSTPQHSPLLPPPHQESAAAAAGGKCLYFL